jgi:hypothetical protein
MLIGSPSSVTKPLQTAQNAAARLIVKSKKREHITPVLHKLHWLPVEQRIKYKICCLVFKVFTGNAPCYLSDLLHTYTPSRTLRSSADTRLLKVVSFNRKQHGARSFCCSAPPVWNSLPLSVRHCTSLETFKTHLKTFLFTQHYNTSAWITRPFCQCLSSTPPVPFPRISPSPTSMYICIYCNTCSCCVVRCEYVVTEFLCVIV